MSPGVVVPLMLSALPRGPSAALAALPDARVCDGTRLLLTGKQRRQASEGG